MYFLSTTFLLQSVIDYSVYIHFIKSTRWVRPRDLPGWIYRYPCLLSNTRDFSVRNTEMF